MNTKLDSYPRRPQICHRRRRWLFAASPEPTLQLAACALYPPLSCVHPTPSSTHPPGCRPPPRVTPPPPGRLQRPPPGRPRQPAPHGRRPAPPSLLAGSMPQLRLPATAAVSQTRKGCHAPRPRPVLAASSHATLASYMPQLRLPVAAAAVSQTSVGHHCASAAGVDCAPASPPPSPGRPQAAAAPSATRPPTPVHAVRAVYQNLWFPPPPPGFFVLLYERCGNELDGDSGHTCMGVIFVISCESICQGANDKEAKKSVAIWRGQNKEGKIGYLPSKGWQKIKLP